MCIKETIDQIFLSNDFELQFSVCICLHYELQTYNCVWIDLELEFETVETGKKGIHCIRVRYVCVCTYACIHIICTLYLCMYVCIAVVINLMSSYYMYIYVA